MPLSLGECPEWQRELTVNQPPHGFEGSSPSSPTNKIKYLFDFASQMVPVPPGLGGLWEAPIAAPLGRPAGCPLSDPIVDF